MRDSHLNTMRKLPFLALAVMAFCIGYPANAQLTAPKLLPFQGRLTDQSGGPVTNGVRLVQFKIYDVPTGGSSVWAGELHRTTVNGGLVNVILGSKTPLDGVDFNKQLYLEITVDVNADNQITAADPPLLPRQSILPAVFAVSADVAAKMSVLDAQGKPIQGQAFGWSAIFDNGNPSTGHVPASKLVNASITTQQLHPSVALGIVPTGTVLPYAGSAAPPGYLLCNGDFVDKTLYPALFAVIGISFGGSGSPLFNLPDLRRRVPVGAGGTGTGILGNAVGNTGGEESHILTIAEMPSHIHTDAGHQHNVPHGAYENGTPPGDSFQAGYQGFHAAQTSDVAVAVIQPTGGDVAHNNMQPSLVVNYIIKY